MIVRMASDISHVFEELGNLEVVVLHRINRYIDSPARLEVRRGIEGRLHRILHSGDIGHVRVETSISLEK